MNFKSFVLLFLLAITLQSIAGGGNTNVNVKATSTTKIVTPNHKLEKTITQIGEGTKKAKVENPEAKSKQKISVKIDKK